MSYSTVSLIGNGTNTQFTVPFSYLKKTDISVTVGGAAQSFTWTNSHAIRLAFTASGWRVGGHYPYHRHHSADDDFH